MNVPHTDWKASVHWANRVDRVDGLLRRWLWIGRDENRRLANGTMPLSVWFVYLQNKNKKKNTHLSLAIRIVFPYSKHTLSLPRIHCGIVICIFRFISKNSFDNSEKTYLVHFSVNIYLQLNLYIESIHSGSAEAVQRAHWTTKRDIHAELHQNLFFLCFLNNKKSFYNQNQSDLLYVICTWKSNSWY